MRIGWWKRLRQKRDARAVARVEECSLQTPAERRTSSGDFTALKTNQRAARTMLEANVGEAERLAEGDEAEASHEG